MPWNYLRLRTLLCLMIVLLMSATAITFIAGRSVISSNKQLIQEQAAIAEWQLMLSTLKDAETGQRGYLLTGNKKYLQPYQDAVAGISRQIAEIRQEGSAGISERSSIAELDRLSQQKLSELKETIILYRDKGSAAALTVVNTDAGKNTMDTIRRVVEDTVAQKTVTLQDLQSQTARLNFMRTTIFIATAFLEAIFCLWAYQRIVKEMQRHASAAAETRRQKDLLAVTLSSIGDAVMVADIQGRATYMNAVAESLTGWSLSEANGKPVAEVFRIINEESRQTVESPVDKVLRLGAVVGLANHTLLIRKDGGELPIDDSGAPIRDEDGKIYGVVLVFRDFTEHKTAERKLIEAKTEAETANRAKDQFLANLSHELRTPLAPVAATLSIWEASEDIPPGLKADVQTLRRNVDLEARLIDDLLDLTRIAKGKLSLNLETVDFHDLLTSVLGIVRGDIAAKSLGLTLDLRATEHFIRGDSARLQQIMWNLLKNAVKFTDSNGRITIKTNDDAGHLNLIVSDSGIGMSAETVNRLFRPFEQGTTEIARRFGGLGLGMAISKALVESQDGTITAQSDGIEKGSTFTVRFPSVKPLLPSETVVIPPHSSAAIQKSIRILLVEDHLDTARAMNRILVSLQHQVQTAHTVAAATALAHQHTFDLLLCDVGLPDGSGLDVVRNIHSVRKIPAIALTGYGMDEDIARCREAGFHAHLTKPVNFQKLQATIHQVTNYYLDQLATP